jgi:flagellar FliL protein
MLVNIVVVALGLGVIVYSHTMLKPKPTDTAAEAEALRRQAIDQSQIAPVPIKKFVVNLHSRASRLRYLDLEMNVLPFHDDQRELIKTHEHLFKDVVIEITSRMEPDELDTVTGKILLETKIKKQVNAKLLELGAGQPVVKQIYFSGFVVQ